MSVQVESQRGREKLVHEGHAYVFAQLSKDNTKEFWRCQFKNSKTSKCLARLHKCLASGEMTVFGLHTDSPDAAAIEVQQKKA